MDLRDLERTRAQFQDIIFHDHLSLTSAEEETVRSRLLKLHSECGCEAGALTFLGCILTAGILAAALRLEVTPGRIGVAFIACTLATAATKFLAISRARHLLRKEIRGLGRSAGR
jgi:hypothetical protein